jgi:protein phosphatase
MSIYDVQQFHGMTTIDDPTVHAPLRRVRIACGALSDQGKVRSNNEDRFLVARLAKSMEIYRSNLETEGETRYSDEDGYLMVVADGMGGAAAGERASSLAVESVESFALDRLKWFLHHGPDENRLFEELRRGMEQADAAVSREADANFQLAGMGTTLTMGFVLGRDLYIVHAGDSRAYLMRDGELQRLTQDHTLVQLLVDGGVISPEDAKHHARRNVVTNVVGGPSPGVHAEIRKVELRDGDIILLCSDGLTEPVSDNAIAEILGSVAEPEDAARALIDRALEAGAPDNVTAIVARFEVR